MADKSLHECLKEARALLAKKGAWGQGYYAMDASGRHVEPHDSQAVRFCAIGAILKVCPDKDHEAEVALSRCVPMGRTVVAYNDAKGRKKSEVLKVYSCAIKKTAPAKRSIENG